MIIKNKKGFTLLEVLGVVLILGILTIVGISSYGKVLKKMKQNYNKKQEELVIQAGREYFNDNHNQLPTVIGKTNCVTLNTLTKNKYIDKVKDYNKKDCDETNSKVCATKISKTKYTYEAEITCFKD